jgi:serine/threonine protein kinase
MQKHRMATVEHTVTDRVGQHFGNYQLIKLLGQGGFAEVYLGKHHYLNIYAAFKVLHTAVNATDEQEFLVEAQRLADLRHPHIVRLLDFGIGNGTPVLVMDYAPNGSLRQHCPRGTWMPLATVVDFVTQIASALQYAHNHNIIHRDVKPENILLDADNRLLLSDFGLSLHTPSSQQLSTQDPAGTPRYNAPEQLRGKPCFASDQYALGIMVYEWLCGKTPFRGNYWELMHQHVAMAPPPLRTVRPAIPVAVERVVLRSLAKNPEDRFVSIQAFAQALARASQTYTPSTEDEAQVTTPMRAVARSSSAATPHYTGVSPVNSRNMQIPARPLTPVMPPVSPARNSNRLRLLTKVRSYWIGGVLEQSLQGAALIRLGLSQQEGAVANPWNLAFQQARTRPDPLPTGTRILQVYDATGGELLILGEPGSGKTTLLLELARDLLNRAEDDETQPLPVIFNLSSWTNRQQPITAWLIEELNNKYQVPRKLGRSWVEADRILPLLDGFDEVAPEARAACMDAINTYRHEHGMLPMVVCSRSNEYFAQGTRVQLSKAVTIQPLTRSQVDDYLALGGEPLWALRVALHKDEALRELTTTPLMLSILTLTYHDMPVESLLRTASPKTLQRQIFEHYVERMLIHRQARERYTAEQTTHWLSWLALRLKRHNQTVFYIERLQPDWLPGRWSYWLYQAIAVWPISAFVGSTVGDFIGGLRMGHIGAVVYSQVGLLVGILMSIIATFAHLNTGDTQSENIITVRWNRLIKILPSISGAMLALLLGLNNEIARGIITSANTTLLLEALLMLLLGASIGLITGILINIRGLNIQIFENLDWSWQRFTKFVHIRNGLLAGLIVPTVLFFSVWRLSFMGSFPLYGIYTIASILICWLLSGLVDVLSSNVLDDSNRMIPNQGIRRSARNSVQISLIVGLTGGLLIGSVLGLIYGLLDGANEGWGIGLLYGITSAIDIGIISGLLRGGDACIKHVVLRLQLWLARRMPWHYARFLDHAAERILLRKVGGGYMFVHRLLLEYFATLDTSKGDLKK